MQDMAEGLNIKLFQSTPYYAQANGQAESSNKVIINIIRKMLEENPRQWHEKLSETLWAYITSKREATGIRNSAHENRSSVVARAYNKRVRNKSFEEREIVWKVVLPLVTHVAGYEKWSPTWEGPFIIKQVLGLEAYRLQDQDRDIHAAPIKGKWLKKFYPTMWDSQAVQTVLESK
ncbi:PREDICTED: retrotransposon [Prunus dulcis]|uniref:PREDICTED: retrotransposon n=1 Tax=Prunus dulcis TaxID=3755 RepID=A0A5E4G5G4_PRUDU|nr:PREDICTED: retrotransposon [Prunus dulcis]